MKTKNKRKHYEPNNAWPPFITRIMTEGRENDLRPLLLTGDFFGLLAEIMDDNHDPIVDLGSLRISFNVSAAPFIYSNPTLTKSEPYTQFIDHNNEIQYARIPKSKELLPIFSKYPNMGSLYQDVFDLKDDPDTAHFPKKMTGNIVCLIFDFKHDMSNKRNFIKSNFLSALINVGGMSEDVFNDQFSSRCLT
ncbi:hypothetical protein JKG47_04290 [Acidithiobacillus sp. MC6.1]|nr:hypothetical protein [Acidithiobacillus sp. MC6.1]